MRAQENSVPRRGSGRRRNAVLGNKGTELERLAASDPARAPGFPADEAGVRAEGHNGGLAATRIGKRNDDVGKILKHGLVTHSNVRDYARGFTLGAETINSRSAYGGDLRPGARAGVQREVESVAGKNASRDIIADGRQPGVASFEKRE